MIWLLIFLQCHIDEGNNRTQVFVCGDAFYVMHYPMKSKSDAAQGLKDFVHQIGIPAQVHTDNAKVETLSGKTSSNGAVHSQPE